MPATRTPEPIPARTDHLPSDSPYRHRPKQGRPFSTDTPLGKLLEARAWRVADLAAASGVNARTLTEYLSGRLEIRAHHRDALARALSTDKVTVPPTAF